MSLFKSYSANLLIDKFQTLRGIQQHFLKKYGVNDIWSNSKIFEIIIANQLGHNLIPGHSGSKDASDAAGNIYEYKHYKKSSSNHTWTFNDYSDTTIAGLGKTSYVIFAHIDDLVPQNKFDWCYKVPGSEIAKHLRQITRDSKNHRKMWNVSCSQIEKKLKLKKIEIAQQTSGPYQKELNTIFLAIQEIERITGIKNLLTSNKIWELLVAIELNHNVNSEQGGRAGAHDAYDEQGNNYEYKVAKNHSWQFQDISDNVLKKYLSEKEIILAVVDKTNLQVLKKYSVSTQKTVALLKQKLATKEATGKEIRRLQASLTKGDLKRLSAKEL